MELNITGRHIEITEGIRAYVSKKLGRLLDEFQRVECVHVILEVEKYRHTAHVFVQAPPHIRIEAKETFSDMYAAIDAAIDKFVKQMKKQYEKLHDHKTRESLSNNELSVEVKDAERKK